MAEAWLWCRKQQQQPNDDDDDDEKEEKEEEEEQRKKKRHDKNEKTKQCSGKQMTKKWLNEFTGVRVGGNH